jgi:signal transduction histidine kinase
MYWIPRFLLQVKVEQEDFLSRIVGFGGFIIVLLAISFLGIFIYSRNRQNQLVIRQRLMQEEFEKQLMKVQIEVQEYTSAALSQELHDHIGQLLSSTKILINLSGRSMAEPPDTLKVAETTLAQAIQDLRALAKSLNNDWLSQFNLIENLETEKARINASRTIDLKLEHSGTRLAIQPDVQMMLFRVIQEAIQNCIKHAEANVIVVEIRSEETLLNVTVTDNGRGFRPDDRKPTGVGLMNMQHRTRLIGGRISWHSPPEGGTEVRICLPVQLPVRLPVHPPADLPVHPRVDPRVDP